MSNDKEDYEARAKREKAEMMEQTATMLAMVGILAGRQLSGKSADPAAVAREAGMYGRALAKELGF